jgi:hypothetical protein
MPLVCLGRSCGASVAGTEGVALGAGAVLALWDAALSSVKQPASVRLVPSEMAINNICLFIIQPSVSPVWLP